MGITIISEDGRFEWNSEKSHQNFRKHGILFDEILSVFDDRFFLTDYDPEHSDSEDRYFGVGNLNGVLVVLVFFTLREGRTRIVSARKAELEVQEAYYEQLKNFQ